MVYALKILVIYFVIVEFNKEVYTLAKKKEGNSALVSAAKSRYYCNSPF